MDTIYTSCVARTPEQHRDMTGAAKTKLYVFDAHETVGQTDARNSKAGFAIRKLTFPRSMMISKSSPDWVQLSVRTSGEKFTSVTPNLGQHYESAVFFSPADKNITVYSSPGHSYLSLGLHRDMISEPLRERLNRALDSPDLAISHVSAHFRKTLVFGINQLLERPMLEHDFNEQIEAYFSSTLDEVERTLQIHISDNRARIIAHAINLIVDNKGKKFTMRYLSEACHCSIRTLEYAFSSRLGLSPKEFLTYFRLNCYRERILSNPSSTLSAQAYELEFKHLGNLAKNYRNLFGTLPSARC
ncbi:MAG: AraC-like DNA-binding protein [Candidatus Azotimanducaceae bacterium]|jgi:AraC-like DNA-binding protein